MIISSLQQLKAGESPKSAIINANFETLRLANNALVERIKNLNYRIKTPPEYNAIIDTLNLFGIVNGVTYDSNKLSAERLNENFEKFKIALLATGGIPNVKARLDLLETQLASIALPNTPTNLSITGIIIVDNAYLSANPDSGYSIGDRIVALTWHDNSNNESDFEIYMPKIEIVNSTLTHLWFSPDKGGYLTSIPIENAESAIINLGQSFLYPLPENMEIPEHLTAVEDLTENNILMSDNTITRGQGVHFAIRAASTDGYSAFAPYAMTWRGHSPYGLYRPNQVEVELLAGKLHVEWHNTDCHITGYEIYASYASTEFSGSENYDKFPYTLIHKFAGDSTTTDVVIDDYWFPPPIYDDITGYCENKYLLIKVVACNEIQRSVVSWDDRADVGVYEIPPETILLSCTYGTASNRQPKLIKSNDRFTTYEIYDADRAYHNLCVNAQGHILATDDGDYTSLYKSTDGGEHFNYVTKLPEVFLGMCLRSDGSIYATNDKTTAYISVDNGDTFQPISISSPIQLASCVEANGKMYCNTVLGRFFESDDGVVFAKSGYIDAPQYSSVAFAKRDESLLVVAKEVPNNVVDICRDFPTSGYPTDTIKFFSPYRDVTQLPLPPVTCATYYYVIKGMTIL